MTEKNIMIKTRRMDSTGDELGILGFGCMRFARKRGTIDLEQAERQVMAAIKGGVNYFDTAYMYPGNEEAIGTILARTDEGVLRRDRVKIATKLPIMLVLSRSDMDTMFAKSLKRLKTDRVDYYLMHNIGRFREWERMKELGALDFLRTIKEDGRALQLGFSWHGNVQDFKKVADDYPWDFCQIQYNYIDENFQAGTEGLEYAAKKGLGVIVMEPLRGGMLVNKMPPQAQRIIENYASENGAKRSPAEWGLRWVWNHPGVTLALSGMNDDAQVAENLAVASDAEPGSLSAADLAMIDAVATVFHESLKVGCTGCSYCMPCPHGVNIPTCFAYYNNKAMFGGMSPTISYAYSTRASKKAASSAASACTRCGACETKCPQSIPIVDTLASVSREMEPIWAKAAMRVARIFVR